MTAAGNFAGPPPPPAWLMRLCLSAAAVAVICFGVVVLAVVVWLALWAAAIAAVVGLVAALVAVGSARLQAWRGRRAVVRTSAGWPPSGG